MPEPTPSSGACVRFLVPPEGELVALAGLDEARAAEGVVDARVYRRPGFVFGPFLRGSDRAGFVLATGRRATMPSRRPTARPTQYASRPKMQLSSSKRKTFLSFQPPAIGPEEIAAVTETLESGWLTTRPARGGARAPARRADRRAACARRRVGHCRHAPLARRPRHRPGRRGDHDADHLARHGQRRRPHGRDARSSWTCATPT